MDGPHADGACLGLLVAHEFGRQFKLLLARLRVSQVFIKSVPNFLTKRIRATLGRYCPLLLFFRNVITDMLKVFCRDEGLERGVSYHLGFLPPLKASHTGDAGLRCMKLFQHKGLWLVGHGVVKQTIFVTNALLVIHIV